MRTTPTITQSLPASANAEETKHQTPGLADAIDRLLRKPEVAQRLEISCRTLDEWMRAGRVPYLKIGKTCRFRWADVLAHLHHHNKVN